MEFSVASQVVEVAAVTLPHLLEPSAGVDAVVSPPVVHGGLEPIRIPHFEIIHVPERELVDSAFDCSRSYSPNIVVPVSGHQFG